MPGRRGSMTAGPPRGRPGDDRPLAWMATHETPLLALLFGAPLWALLLIGWSNHSAKKAARRQEARCVTRCLW
jgi:hypothetical protein